MSEILSCGAGGSTNSGVINRINQNEALMNSKPNKNLIINGNMLINQREFDGVSWIDGQYAYDRWKATTISMTQIIEDGSYEYNSIYTLSGINIVTQQVNSPSSGHWTLQDLPRTARNIKLEKGVVATPYQPRLIGEESALCERYYSTGRSSTSPKNNTYFGTANIFPTTMRTIPTITITDHTTQTGVISIGAGALVAGIFDSMFYSDVLTDGDWGNWCRLSWTADAEL